MENKFNNDKTFWFQSIELKIKFKGFLVHSNISEASVIDIHDGGTEAKNV